MEDKLLGRMGMVDAHIAQAKKAAGHLQTAAEKYDTGAGERLEELAQQIQEKGVGADEKAEKEYCRLLAGRHRMQQTWNLSEQDRQRFPDVAERLAKGKRSKAMPGQGAFDFDAEAHPRAAVGGQEKYKGGQFVPKAHSWAPTPEQKEELKHLRARLKGITDALQENRAASDKVPYPEQEQSEKDPTLYPAWQEAVKEHTARAAELDAEKKAIWLRAKELLAPHLPPAPVYTGAEADEYQRRGTRAEAFLHWFGDWENDPEGASKVVRESDGQPAETHNMTPIKVYHGTAFGGFDAFDPERDSGHNIFGKGFYFTEDRGIADEYRTKDSHTPSAKCARCIGVQDAKGKAVTSLPRRWFDDYLLGHDNPNWDRLIKVAMEAATSGKQVDVAKFLEVYRDPTTRIPSVFGGGMEPAGHNAGNGQGLATLFGKFKLTPVVPKGETFECYLNIRNPYDMDAPATDAEVSEFIDYVDELEDGRHGFHIQPDDLMGHDQWETLVKDEFGGVFPEHPTVSDLLTLKRSLMTVMKMEADPDKPGKFRPSDKPLHGIFHLSSGDTLTKGDFHYIISDGHHYDFERQRFRQWLHERGNDGIHHTGGFNIGTHNHSVWIAFHPSQIKSVYNEGTFNPEDPSLFKALRLLVGVDL